MESSPTTIIDTVRSLMPSRTLYLLARPLTEAEARVVAERQAAKLLRLLGITKPSVEIELIMELPDIEVEVLPDLPLSGSSDWTHDHWHIQINADDSLWRCRSTLAHEFKHILDDPFREELYPGWSRNSTLAPPLEVENISEYFAGCVLVPRAWLYNSWDNGVRDPAELASLFDVSQSLIEVRIGQTRVTRADTSARWRRYPRHTYQRGARLIRAARRHLGQQRKTGATQRQKAVTNLTGGKRDDQHYLRPLITATAA
jgi:Zn-dependent peptidase ImmA (M78 family)